MPLTKESQYLFAFEWEAPGEKYQQMTCTVLPQGFRDSPHLFQQALSRDLLDLDLGPNGKILQYVEYLLTSSSDEKNAQQHGIQVLKFFWQRGDIKSPMLRHRWWRQRSLTWEFRLHTGSRRLSSDWVQGILQLLSPRARKQLWAFLGLTGYCRIWIANYCPIAQPLYESLKGQDDSIPLMGGTPQKKAKATLK